ncbi:O-antigen ligase family protein [Rossellomorea sp. NPDC077527]|uniref:O-antigen ligase family protein n=1 Tax=Rossellomorea sp. NPDC077527 TaxID=3364510 RepID=UPI0037C5BEBB
MINNLWGTLILLIGITPFVNNLTYYRTRPEFITNAMAGNLQHVIYIIIVFYCIYIFISSFKTPFLSDAKKLNSLTWGFFLMMMGPFFSQFLGFVPSFNISIYIMLLVFVTTNFLPEIEVISLIKYIKRVLIYLYGYGSLVYLLLAPENAASLEYSYGIIGLDIRLNGLANHSNVLALLMIIYLLLDIFGVRYSERLRVNKFNHLVAVVVIILAQSKTIWIAMLICYLIMFLYAYGKNKNNKYLLISLLFFSLSTLLIALVMLLNKINDFFIEHDIYTLTGRTEIWRNTIEMWKLNPMFGYGQSLWSESMAQTYFPQLMWVPGHAHSQFFQTLGESGIFGVVFLCIYIIIFIISAIKYARSTSGLTIVLVFVLLIRGISDPIFISNIFNASFFVHFCIFSLFILLGKSEKATS